MHQKTALIPANIFMDNAEAGEKVYASLLSLSNHPEETERCIVIFPAKWDDDLGAWYITATSEPYLLFEGASPLFERVKAQIIDASA